MTTKQTCEINQCKNPPVNYPRSDHHHTCQQHWNTLYIQPTLPVWKARMDNSD